MEVDIAQCQYLKALGKLLDLRLDDFELNSKPSRQQRPISPVQHKRPQREGNYLFVDGYVQF